MNKIWLAIMLISFLYGFWQGNFAEMSDAILSGAQDGVMLSINLLGPISLWLGLMKVAEEGGIVQKLQNILRPLVKILFPEVPEGHPAQGAILMNLSANLLGMGNAATPLGIKAMKHLQELNVYSSRASKAMCTFLVINTSSITILPATIIGLRAASGSSIPSATVVPTIMATAISTITAILIDRLYRSKEGKI